MIRYFITSDIHGFYDEFRKALKRAGFDENNPDHRLVICGDIFDRGTQPLQIYSFLRSLPKERRILIRGNHEALLKELVEKGYPESHDLHNGTYDTLAYIAKLSKKDDFRRELSAECDDFSKIMDELHAYERKLFHNKKLKEILKWIYSDEWVNYWELNDYIFVHSFIPTAHNEKIGEFGELFGASSEEYDPDWRNAFQSEWDEAMWGCPWRKYEEGLNQTGKTIVCGHWHTSDFWNHLDDRRLDLHEHNPIFRKKGVRLIGLDACTAATRGVNVLVMNENGRYLKFYDHDKESEDEKQGD